MKKSFVANQQQQQCSGRQIHTHRCFCSFTQWENEYCRIRKQHYTGVCQCTRSYITVDNFLYTLRLRVKVLRLVAIDGERTLERKKLWEKHICSWTWQNMTALFRSVDRHYIHSMICVLSRFMLHRFFKQCILSIKGTMYSFITTSFTYITIHKERIWCYGTHGCPNPK